MISISYVLYSGVEDPSGEPGIDSVGESVCMSSGSGDDAGPAVVAGSGDAAVCGSAVPATSRCSTASGKIIGK